MYQQWDLLQKTGRKIAVLPENFLGLTEVLKLINESRFFVPQICREITVLNYWLVWKQKTYIAIIYSNIKPSYIRIFIVCTPSFIWGVGTFWNWLRLGVGRISRRLEGTQSWGRIKAGGWLLVSQKIYKNIFTQALSCIFKFLCI